MDEPVLIITWERPVLCDWYSVQGAKLTYCPKIATHCIVYADSCARYRCSPHVSDGRQLSVYDAVMQALPPQAQESEKGITHG